MRLRKRMAQKNDIDNFYEQKKNQQKKYRNEFYEDAEKAKEMNHSNVEYLKITRDYGHK